MNISHPLYGMTLSLLISGCNAAVPDRYPCPTAISVSNSKEYRVVASDRVVKKLSPHFFGFNLEWVGFQEDLWDDSAGAARRELVDALRAFPGAVYRYPGGTVANHFDWRASVGPQSTRTPRRAVEWKGPLATRFGFHEYLHFLSEVNGQAWLVTNLHGSFDAETKLAELAGLAGEWAAEAKRIGTQVLRWELGNELDRDRYLWPPEKYTARAMDIAKSIQTNDPTARFVAMLQDYDAQPWTTANSYNTLVGGALASLSPDYALHLYYDGPPGGPPIPHRLRHLCASAGAAASGSGKPALIWVTEHARWPSGRSNDRDWKLNWYKTTSMEGAIGVADMVIALSQVPSVEGAFLHSLSGTSSPWPLLHRTSSGLRPSAVYWGLRVLRENMLDQVLETKTESRHESGYAGGYDVRASVMRDEGRRIYVVWAVNRAGQLVNLRLRLPISPSAKLTARLHSLSDTNPDASNAVDGQRVLPEEKPLALLFDKSGETSIQLPAYSVSALIIGK